MKHPIYLAHLARHSDIREHLGLLRGLALDCDVVVELGFRTGVSTSAFLAAERPIVHSYDLLPSDRHVAEMRKAYPDRFCFHAGDSREVTIPKCDLLFIDTDHTYETTSLELRRHWTRVNRWIVLHDTETFGRVDRGAKPKRGGKQGILTAVEEFIENYRWRVAMQIRNNNGLTILEHDRSRQED